MTTKLKCRSSSYRTHDSFHTVWQQIWITDVFIPYT